MVKFVSVFITPVDFTSTTVFFLPCFSHLLPLPCPPFPLSLSVNENVLTRKKDLLGVAQFIRKAEVWKEERERERKKRRRALQRSPILVVVNV